MIDIAYSKCAGWDVHKKFVTVCRLVIDNGNQVHKELRKVSTMTGDLRAMADWLAGSGVTHVAMESTGVYWKPIYNLLEDRFEIFLVNPQAIKRMPGRKTDMKDAEWIATLLQHGLLQRSFVPDREQRELRELARYRQSLIQERSRFANRLQKVLEDTNIKLSAVASDMQGVSAQAMLRALLDGQTDPHVLANMARGRMRNKRDELERALEGHLTEHHRFLLTDLLIHLDFLDEQITKIEERLETKLEHMPPFQEAICLLDTIPGVDRQTAILVVAEMGVDMKRFPSDRHLAAWAGLAPGNNETGGKQISGKSRKGNKFIKSALVLASHGASHSKATYLRSLYYRLSPRIGKQRASVAVARTILQAAYYMILRHEEYHDLGEAYLDQRDKQYTAKRLVKRLQALGYEVNVKDLLSVDPGSVSQESATSTRPLAI